MTFAGRFSKHYARFGWRGETYEWNDMSSIEQSRRARGGRHGAKSGTESGVSISSDKALGRELGELGLTSNEARILLALFQLGSANTVQLARVAGLQRTSVYPVLDALAGRGLVDRLPDDGPAVWATPGLEEVFERLNLSLEEQLNEQLARSSRVRDAIARTVAVEAPPVLPYVRLIPEAGQAKRAFEQLMDGAESEVLMFTRPPYSWDPGQPNPSVVDMLRRGVATRVLYQVGDIKDVDAEAVRSEILEYHRLGVEGRLVNQLPMKLAVVDRKRTLLAMTGPALGRGEFPTALLIDDPGCATVNAAAFEYLWGSAEPYVPVTARASRRGRDPKIEVAAESSRGTSSRSQ